jgi:hypothetical protein
MFLALVGERPSPARIPKNLLAGGTGSVHTDSKSTQRLEIPMAVSDALNADDRIAVGVSVNARNNYEHAWRTCRLQRQNLPTLS